MEEVGGGPTGPFEDLEVIRIEEGVSTSRFCRLFEIPERTWRRWQAKARAGPLIKGPWPRPARQAARELVVQHALKHPAREAPGRIRGRWSAMTVIGPGRRPCCGSGGKST